THSGVGVGFGVGFGFGVGVGFGAGVGVGSGVGVGFDVPNVSGVNVSNGAYFAPPPGYVYTPHRPEASRSFSTCDSVSSASNEPSGLSSIAPAASPPIVAMSPARTAHFVSPVTRAVDGAPCDGFHASANRPN